MAAKTVKGLKSEVTKLKEQIAKAKAKATAAKAKAAAKKAKADAAKSAKKAKIATKKKRQVFSAGEWTGAKPKKLTIYKVRLMLDEQQIGVFGPYATIRAASADAKNILRMHVGPGFKIEEIGVDEPVLRSDGRVKAYFHPSIYSAQGTDKGVLTAQVIEQGGEAQRTKTFVKKYNPAKRSHRAARSNPRGYVCVNDRYCPQPDTFASLAEFQAMCKAAFGERAHLTRRGSDYVDERGQVVLRALTRRANPHVSFRTRSGQVISFDAKKK